MRLIMMRSFCLGIDYVPRRCRWVMNYWAFSLCGLFGLDYFPKALPLGYGLLDFQSVWIVL